MENKLLAYYLNKFKRLRRDHKHGGAPHKPILLLSIIQLIDENVISNNRIHITPQLVAKFKDFWRILVNTPHNPNFSLPFFHLRSEGFWHLINKPGFEIALTKSHSIRSFRNLKSAVNYASFDDNLYKLLTEAENRELFKFTILEKYFPKASNSYLNQKQYDIFQQHELEILNEDPEIYIQKIKSIEASMDAEEIEEERFIRNGAFREQVLKSYQYSCSISGLSITSTANISIIDACHIMPFSESYNDHITNGIALCPNLHRAYDRGLLTFNDDYTVKISNDFIE
ncbi:MAG: HNH endonuclease, partial [Fulvivirga sp.]|nr:HNH endonuclease [Fulvivirga sp.]